MLLVPVFVLRALRRSRRAASAVQFSDVTAIPAHRAPVRPLVASCLPWLRIAAFVLLILALGRPQSQGSLAKETAEGIDIILTLDTSGSMLAQDFAPRDRFTAARDILQRFALQTENDRLGIVIFAEHAFTQCPLTLDNEMVAELIGGVKQGIVGDATAIGMAIATAAHRLRESKAKSRVIILLTDGVNNAGKIDPITAAKAAAALGIRIHVIGVGAKTGRPVLIDHPRYGKQYVLIEFDEMTLKKVAKIGGGKYFRATDSKALAKIYAEIRTMEKTRFEITKRRPVIEEFPRYLWPAALLLVLAFALDATIARKAP